MTIIKYTIIFLAVFGILNLLWWGYQEYLYREDTIAIRSLDNQINIDRTRIEQRQQELDVAKKFIDSKTPTINQLRAENNIIEYNKLASEQNTLIDEYNASANEYNALLNNYNDNIKQINELLTRSGTRRYIFPIPPYVPEQYTEL